MTDLLSKLPIADQKKHELAMARKQVLDSVKPDLDNLSRAVRDNIQSQIESLPQEDTQAILKALQSNPVSQVIDAIRNGAFSKTEEESTKSEKVSLFGAIVAVFSNKTGSRDEKQKYRKTRIGFSGEIKAQGPRHESPSFTASANVSQSKASAVSHDNNSRAGAKTNETSGQAIVDGSGTAASSTTIVRGKVSFSGSKTDYGSVEIKNKD